MFFLKLSLALNCCAPKEPPVSVGAVRAATVTAAHGGLSYAKVASNKLQDSLALPEQEQGTLTTQSSRVQHQNQHRTMSRKSLLSCRLGQR